MNIAETKGPLLVKFQADWCGPCKQLAPILASVAEKHTIDIIEVDIDARRDLVEQYRVRAVPTVLAVLDGEVKGVMTGVADRSRVEEFIRNHL